MQLSDCCVDVLVFAFKDTILAECRQMIRENETEKLRLMFSLMDRITGGVTTMLSALEDHIISAGLADMLAAADSITQVNYTLL